MKYRTRLNQLRALSAHEIVRRVDALCEMTPKRLRPWPSGMPASLEPKLVLIGPSRGGSAMAGDPGYAPGYTSVPSIKISRPRQRPVPKTLESHFYYPDTSRHWEKVRYLVHQFCLREGSVRSEADALSLCSHFNLSNKRAGSASGAPPEPDVTRWVSRLLNTYHNPDLVVLFGLSKSLRDVKVRKWCNWSGDLAIDWSRPDSTRTFTGYEKDYKYREWTVQNAQGHTMKVVIWPNHPARFFNMKLWKLSVDEYLDSIALG